MTPWIAGSRLGPYELLSPIGAGGMGEVWKALDTRLDRVVAVKRLKTGHTQRFQQEARAIAALNHPHICQLYDIGPDYLVMEYVEGKPVISQKEPNPVPTEEAVRLAIQIATALEEAHAKGILHRDLKPANILVTTQGAAKLLDFGLAKLTADADATQTMAIMGTPLYMSPEQAEGKTLDGRSDIFSFGAVLYEMLSGRRAFESLAAVLRDAPAPLNANGPGGAPEIAIRCLAKQPTERFQTAAELRAALEHVPVKRVEHQPSIAVLPFANMSADKEQEYFSDGLAEEIINALAQIPGLKVTARTSAFAFRGKEQDITRIAQALNVRTILEGSVRRAGNRIRVTAQLINAADGYHLWSQRYDRELADVFEVQDEIAAAIAQALKVKLSPKPATDRYKPNLPAYEAFLKARHLYGDPTPDALARARQYYEQAIALDPKFALAYSELAGQFGALAVLGMRSPQEVMPHARLYAQKALDLDPSLPEAHAILALHAAEWDYDWKEAGRRFKMAMAHEPVPPFVRLYYGVYLLDLGRPLEALQQFQRAVEEDPLFLVARFNLARSLHAAGKDEEALLQARHILEIDSNFLSAFGFLGIYHAARGEFAEALRSAERCYSLAPHLPQSIGLLAGLLARRGDVARSQELLQKLGTPETYGVPRAFALFHLMAGAKEKAVAWYEKMIDQRDNMALATPWMPYAKAFRESPRWPELAKKMNLPGGV